jgi:hypothetical protein
MRRFLFSAIVGLATVSTAFAVTEFPMTGSLYLAQEGCENGTKGENCIFNIEITGKAAETLYKGMKAKTERDECIVGTAKRDSSGLSCYKPDDGDYSCDFGYHFRKSKFGDSTVVC